MTRFILAASLLCAVAVAQTPAPATIPVNTRFDMRLKTTLNSQKAAVGDPFEAEVIAPGKNGNNIVIPKHSLVKGTIVSTLPYQKGVKAGGLAFKINELVTPDGQMIPLTAIVQKAYVDKFYSAGDAADVQANHSLPSTFNTNIQLSMESQAIRGIPNASFQTVGGDATAVFVQHGQAKIEPEDAVRLEMVVVPRAH